MQKFLLASIVSAVAVASSAADAQTQWNDALQFENTNVSGPFSKLFPANISPVATDLAVQVVGADCGAGNSLPAFTADGLPIVGGVESLKQFGPTNCTSAGATQINLNQFARQSDVVNLQVNVANLQNGFAGLQGSVVNLQGSVATLQNGFAALQAQIAAINQFSQTLHNASVRANQGVAMSLAMAGTADLQPDEHIAFSGNWGTFQGENGGALGVAYRISQHVSINGGVTASLDGNTYGGRAGIRFGW